MTTDNERLRELLREHPCFSESAHMKYGRVHLPVSPSCNISCRYCQRHFNDRDSQRPGVSCCVLSPEEAVGIVEKSLQLCPQIRVAGVAGPGDPLATDHAIETFGLVHQKFPQLIMCLSTNGLLLKEKAEQLLTVGVKAVTVTVNAVDLGILQQICSSIFYNGRRLTDAAAARWLILAQLAGIEEVVKLGMAVKINSVLVPGVNDRHIGEVSRITAGLGASLINIIPLIPQSAMSDYRAPSCQELQQARESAEQYLPVFRRCQHCRADACGIPGSHLNLVSKLYTRQMNTFSHG
jgi:nitrogen fixation protein NifB